MEVLTLVVAMTVTFGVLGLELLMLTGVCVCSWDTSSNESIESEELLAGCVVEKGRLTRVFNTGVAGVELLRRPDREAPDMLRISADGGRSNNRRRLTMNTDAMLSRLRQHVSEIATLTRDVEEG